MPESAMNKWLLLIHQIPPVPSYLRAKVGRRLQGLGAVAVKKSVYVLPCSERSLEDFQWVRREIVDGGGDASVCEAHFVEGLSDSAVEALFVAAREGEYTALAAEARRLQSTLGRRKSVSTDRGNARSVLIRLQKRCAEIAAIDFFTTPGRGAVEDLLRSLESSLRPVDAPAKKAEVPSGEVSGRTWVTRSGVHIDRIACAWLIRRFIDSDATFKFVPGHDYEPEPGELRFDMFEGEFTHEGDMCSFEVLLQRFRLSDKALRPIAEIVHDIDVKDGKYARAEAAGLSQIVAGIAMRQRSDEGRINDGCAVFESLYESFKRKR
jgi:hypothetical protein